MSASVAIPFVIAIRVRIGLGVSSTLPSYRLIVSATDDLFRHTMACGWVCEVAVRDNLASLRILYPLATMGTSPQLPPWEWPRYITVVAENELGDKMPDGRIWWRSH